MFAFVWSRIRWVAGCLFWLGGLRSLALAEGFRLDADARQLLQTGGSSALHSGSISLAPPLGITARELSFTAGFASEERLESATFLDAFSVSLQRSIPSAYALLFTVDAPGVVWRPPLPDGLTLAPEALTTAAANWPEDLAAAPALRFVFRVTLALPREFQRGRFEVLADLFDNLDTRVSLGWIEHLALRTDPFFLLESSASVAGPYAVEPAAQHDAVAKVFRLPRPDIARFFRLRADADVVLTIDPPAHDAWRFHYLFPEATPTLEVSSNLQGPFSLASEAVLDASTRTFRLPYVEGNRFFRLRGAVRAALGRPRLVASRVELTFEFRPRVFSLDSSAQPCGPFAPEPLAHFDLAAQTIDLSRPDPTRFFRLVREAGAARPVIQRVRPEGDTWRIDYAVESRGAQ